MASTSNHRQTLDEVLADIHRGPRTEVASVPASPQMKALTDKLLAEATAYPQEHRQPPASEFLLGRKSSLTARQKSLPRLQLSRMVGGLAVMVLLVLGASSATYLSLQSQDVRQQAYDGELAQYTAVVSQLDQESQVQQQEQVREEQRDSVLTNRMLFGGILIVLAALLLLGAIFWLFAV